MQIAPVSIGTRCVQFARDSLVFSIFSTHYFWLSIGASALNSTILAIAAGFAAKTDGGSLLVVVLLLTILSHLVSCLFFLSGKGAGTFVHRFVSPSHTHSESNHFRKVSGYIQRYDTLYIFMYRFIPGLRIISPYIIAMNTERYSPFFVIDVLAALLWALLFGSLGYLFGTAASRMIDNFSHYATEIFLGVAAVAVSLAIAKLVYYKCHRTV